MFQAQQNPFASSYIAQPLTSTLSPIGPFGVISPLITTPQYASNIPAIPAPLGYLPQSQLASVIPGIQHIASIATQTFFQHIARVAYEVAQRAVYQTINELAQQRGTHAPWFENTLPGQLTTNHFEQRTPWGAFPISTPGLYQPALAQSPLPFLNVQGVPMQNPLAYAASPTCGPSVLH